MMVCLALVGSRRCQGRPQRQLSRLSRRYICRNCRNCCRSCQNPEVSKPNEKSGETNRRSHSQSGTAFSPYAVDAMHALTAQRPGAGQLSTFGTPYIIQQLQSNPQVTRQAAMVVLSVRRETNAAFNPKLSCRELLTDINVTLKTPLPSPVSLLLLGQPFTHRFVMRLSAVWHILATFGSGRVCTES